MEINRRFRHVGLIAFFLSGVCAISSGVIVSVLQEKHGFSFGATGTLLSAMSIGNMAAAFLSGLLPSWIGQRRTVLLLCAGYFLGYLISALSGWMALLLLAFLLVGLAKGCALNTCTVLVGANSEDRPKGLQVLHACYALGALLCPFLIAALSGISLNLPMIGVALCGLTLWSVFAAARLPNRPSGGGKGAGRADRAFLRSPVFWLLTALIFCQNAAETSVTGWLVTYYRQQEILNGSLSGYTMTIMWGATLIARLLIAFAVPVRRHFRALFFMGLCCTALYAAMIPLRAMGPALLALFCFAFAMAGVNPMTTASVGKAISPESMGVLLPVGALGGIVMPLVIGWTADRAGLQTGMLVNLVPCAGIAALSAVLWKKYPEE